MSGDTTGALIEAASLSREGVVQADSNNED